MRLSIFLQVFRFQATYSPGYMNGNADGLSRQDWEDTEWSSHGTGVTREFIFSVGHSSLGGGDVVDHPTTGTLKHIGHFMLFVQVMQCQANAGVICGLHVHTIIYSVLAYSII